jgi:tetratricopeptide (TPR) repeat protein
MSESPNRFHCLDADVWIEVPDRVIGVTGNCYVGRDYIPKNGKTRYDVRIFVKEIKMEQEDHDTLINDNALKLSRCKSNDIDALIEKGVNLRNFGKYDEALQVFDKVTELEPSNVQAWHNKGIVLGILKKYNEALQAFEKALELEPEKNCRDSSGLRRARNKTSERDRGNEVVQ